MPRINFAIVYKNEELFEIHKIIRPSPSEKDFYRQSLSMDSFKNKHIQNKSLGLEYFILTGKEFEIQFKKEYNNMTAKEHLSVWDFYKDIKWDYKKKNFE